MSPSDQPHGNQPELPEELARLLQQLGGPGLLGQIRQALSRAGGPVDWQLARRLAVQLAAEGDRSPTAEETTATEQAQQIAEHWLDEGGLPAPPDTGRLAVVSRQAWTNAALEGLRPLVEPLAAASIRALGELLSEAETAGPDALELTGFGDQAGDMGGLLQPLGAVLMGLQTGQVIGRLARQMIGQFDLGAPTAAPATAYRLPVNAAAAFDGWGLDPTEVGIVLALHEGAHRRQYHAVGWLASHLKELVALFAEGTTVDVDRLLDVSREVMADVDPEDPASLRSAMERASEFRLEPTPEQERVLERIQGVVCLLQAWARREVGTAAEQRLPNLGRVEEVLRRRRAEQGHGERLLAGLLGLDLRPEDETLGDEFVATVADARGLAGLRRALAHPENLPDTEELAEPSKWLVRMAGGEGIPDDPSAIFGTGQAPTEPSAAERIRPGGSGHDDSDTAGRGDPDHHPQDDGEDDPPGSGEPPGGDGPDTEGDGNQSGGHG